MELQSASGAFFSVSSGDRPTLNYWSANYRVGRVLTDPSGSGVFRGNWQPLLQLFGGTVFDGPGNALGGAALLMRYNFIQPGSRWVPYIQVGLGMLLNDIHKDQSQRLIGQAWEFDLEAGAGVRYMLSAHWSLAAEGGFRNISNWNLNKRDVSLSSLGALVGIGFHF